MPLSALTRRLKQFFAGCPRKGRSSRNVRKLAEHGSKDAARRAR